MSEWTTLIPASTAVIATVVSLVLLRQRLSDRRELRHARNREQATLVTSWADWHVPEAATFAKPRLPAVYVRNSSTNAAYDVFVDYRTPVDGQLVRQTIGPVPPGTTRHLAIDFEGRLIDQWVPAAMCPRVYFRDSAGRRWVRDSLGRLREDSWIDDEFFESGGVVLPN